MAAVDEIAIRLGLKMGDLKAALVDAGAEVRKFKKDAEGDPSKDPLGIKGAHKSLEGFKKFLVAGGVLVAVYEFFNKAYEQAKKTEGAIDDDTAAVLRLGAKMDQAKELFANASVTITGWFVKLGEGIGKAAGALVYGKEAVKDSEKLAAIEAQRVLEKAKEEKINETLKNLQQQLTAEAQRHHDLTVKDLTDTEKIARLKREAAQAEQLLINAGDDKVRRETALLNLKKAQNALLEAQVEIDKKDRQEAEATAAKLRAQAEADLDLRREDMTLSARKKSIMLEIGFIEEGLAYTDAKSKEYAEQTNRILELRKQLKKGEEEQGKANIEIATLLLKGENNLTDVEKEKLKLLKGETTEKKQQQEVTAMLQKGVENLTEAERERLRVLVGQSKELVDQTVETTKQIDALTKFRQNSISNQGDVRTLSNTQLQALAQKLSIQLEATKQQDMMQGGVGGLVGTYKSIMQLQEANNLAAVQRELEARRSFEQTIKAMGVEFAERTFSPDEFARLSQLINPDVVKQQAKDISAITQTLTNLFPKQAANIRPPTP